MYQNRPLIPAFVIAMGVFVPLQAQTPPGSTVNRSPSSPGYDSTGKYEVSSQPQAYLPEWKPQSFLEAQMAADRVKSAFSLLSAPAGGFRAMNQALWEASEALAKEASQAVGKYVSPEVVKSLLDANLAGLQWYAEDRLGMKSFSTLVDILKSSPEILDGALLNRDGVRGRGGNPLKVTREVLLGPGLGLLPGVGPATGLVTGLVKGLLEAGLKAGPNPLSDEDIIAMEDAATLKALQTLAGSSSLQFVSNTNMIDVVTSAVKAALNSVTGGSQEATDAMDELVASGKAAEIIKAAANAGLNTSTVGAPTGADAAGGFVASGQAQEVIKAAVEAGLKTSTAGAPNQAAATGEFVASGQAQQVASAAAKAAAATATGGGAFIIDHQYYTLDGGQTWRRLRDALTETSSILERPADALVQELLKSPILQQTPDALVQELLKSPILRETPDALVQELLKTSILQQTPDALLQELFAKDSFADRRALLDDSPQSHGNTLNADPYLITEPITQSQMAGSRGSGVSNGEAVKSKIDWWSVLSTSAQIMKGISDVYTATHPQTTFSPPPPPVTRNTPAPGVTSKPVPLGPKPVTTSTTAGQKPVVTTTTPAVPAPPPTGTTGKSCQYVPNPAAVACANAPLLINGVPNYCDHNPDGSFIPLTILKCQ